MIKKENTLWVEKYRPTNIEDYLCSDVLKYSVERYIKKNDIPSMLLYGDPGQGKTTLAKLLVKSLNCSYIYINASDERNIDTVREKITNFVSAASPKPLKVVILDESDYLNKDSSQPALRNLIETYSNTSRFIFTANYPDKLIQPLKDRLVQYKIETPSKKEVKIYLANILEKEEVSYEPGDVTSIVNTYYPSIRSCIKNLQNMVVDSELQLNFGKVVNNSYLCNVLELLQKPSKNTWQEIRQVLLDAEITDYSELYKFLFDNVNTISENNAEEIVLHIAETQKWDPTIPDKEINVVSLIINILKTIKK